MSKVTDGLNVLLSDALVLYQKLHHYHWNIGGDEFFSLHVKFEELYDQWALFLDDVAERILTVGGAPVRTLAQALETTSLQEDPGLPDDDEDFVKNILADFEAVLENIKGLVAAAEEEGDRGTAALLDDITGQVEKDGWMLKAYLKD
ncbi:MAG: DNA starvation/stationary phase protection protein [Chloroflexi bacterium]|nr:DNA starvation/stationary phase protection protein [Chloroflexota bacterium]